MSGVCCEAMMIWSLHTLYIIYMYILHEVCMSHSMNLRISTHTHMPSLPPKYMCGYLSTILLISVGSMAFNGFVYLLHFQIAHTICMAFDGHTLHIKTLLQYVCIHISIVIIWCDKMDISLLLPSYVAYDPRGNLPWPNVLDISSVRVLSLVGRLW